MLTRLGAADVRFLLPLERLPFEREQVEEKEEEEEEEVKKMKKKRIGWTDDTTERLVNYAFSMPRHATASRIGVIIIRGPIVAVIHMERIPGDSSLSPGHRRGDDE